MSNTPTDRTDNPEQGEAGLVDPAVGTASLSVIVFVFIRATPKNGLMAGVALAAFTLPYYWMLDTVAISWERWWSA